MDNQTLNALLDDAANRDRTTARRAELARILTYERFLTRQQLINRVEARLGTGCFGEKAWEDTFFRDMRIVKKAMRAGGNSISYSRKPASPGYYIKGKVAISKSLKNKFRGAIEEIDSNQIDIFRKLSVSQRFQQGCSISNLARNVVAQRIRLRNPKISEIEAQRLAIQEVKYEKRSDYQL